MPTSPFLEAGGSIVRLSVLSDGEAVPSFIQFISVSVRKQINRISSAEIILLDGDMPKKDFPLSSADYFVPGKKLTIKAGYGSAEEAIFEGVIVKHGIKISSDNNARLVIECRDPAVVMTVGRKNANFIDMTDGDIIKKVISAAGSLTANVDGTTIQHKELVQYYSTDWDFVLSRAEVNGLIVIVDDGKVTVKAPVFNGSPALKVTYGMDLIEFQAEIDARTQFSKVAGVAWDIKKLAIVEQEASPTEANAQGNLDAATLAEVLGLTSVTMQTPVPLATEALKAWIKGQQLKASLAKIRGRMKFQGSALAKIGELIELEGVGDRFSGKVYVSALSHQLSGGHWTTEVEFGMAPEWFIERTDIVAPSASGLLPGIEGLHVGIVKKLDADPEGHYRIQVSIPVLKAPTDGFWARLASFYASDGIGTYFVPEIGDEVVLGFFNNDPSNPIILGSLYSSKRKPPFEHTADNFTKAFVTKSKIEIKFDDEKKILSLATPGKNKIIISDDGKSITLQDQSNNKIVLDESGISLDSPKDIVISAKGKVSISAVGNIALDAKSDVVTTGLNITNTANVGFTAKGNATAEVSASGQTTVKGAMVMIN